jgi:hypothetical protein
VGPRGSDAGSGSRLNMTRGWQVAKARCIEVKDCGRVPAEVVARFKAVTEMR